MFDSTHFEEDPLIATCPEVINHGTIAYGERIRLSVNERIPPRSERAFVATGSRTANIDGNVLVLELGQ